MPQDYISDGVHFDDTGYALIAHLMYEGLLTEDATDAGAADDAGPGADATEDDAAAGALGGGDAAGAPTDASVPRPDSGVAAGDAGAKTTGIAIDAPAPGSGCGCSLGPSPATATAGWLAVVGLASARRRRRRRP